MDPATAILLAKILIPIVVPILVHGAKTLGPMIGAKLPSWLLPILAPIFGAVVGQLTTGDPTTGAALGLAGVGVREVVNQTITGTKP